MGADMHCAPEDSNVVSGLAFQHRQGKGDGIWAFHSCSYVILPHPSSSTPTHAGKFTLHKIMVLQCSHWQVQYVLRVPTVLIPHPIFPPISPFITHCTHVSYPAPTHGKKFAVHK